MEPSSKVGWLAGRPLEARMYNQCMNCITHSSLSLSLSFIVFWASLSHQTLFYPPPCPHPTVHLSVYLRLRPGTERTGNKVSSAPGISNKSLLNPLSCWDVEGGDHFLLKDRVLFGCGGRRPWVQKHEPRAIYQGSTPIMHPKAHTGC